MSGAPALAYRRLRAPRENGGVLSVPDWESIPGVLAENERRQALYSCEILGRSLRDLALWARKDLLRGAVDYTAAYRDVPDTSNSQRLFLAGHQPNLFHAGVWLKNFALAELARRHQGVAVNLVIDSDTIKVAAIKVPGGSVESPREEVVAMDRPTAEIPFEDRAIVDPGTLLGFSRRACEVVSPLVRDPLVCQFWPLVIERTVETNNLGACLAQARHRLEGKWGSSSLEYPQSRVCQLEGFAWFAADLLERLPAFREVHNASVLDYRRVHGVRSANHPVPLLQTDQEWLEAPFWVWHASNPRRRRLFVRRSAGELELTDRAGWSWSLPAKGDASRTVEALLALPAQGVRLRTKALITTMFARLFLSDLFIHGIGGGKYDQVTDLLVQRFYGVAPPAYVILSGTLELPIPRTRPAPSAAARLKQALREMTYHPERFLGEVATEATADRRPREEIEALVAAKRRWIEAAPPRGAGRTRCCEIRSANEQLQPLVAPLRRRAEDELAMVESLLASERILSNREFAFCLHPEQTLRRFLLDFCLRPT